MKNIVETALDNPDFSTLVTTIKAAGLVQTLSGPGPFTVLAPTDAAFSKIPKGTLQDILADKTRLTSILAYHVISGKVLALDVIKLHEAKTLQGSEVKIQKQGRHYDK